MVESEAKIHSVESCNQVDCLKMKLIFCTSAYMEIEHVHVENSPKSHFHQLLPILQIRNLNFKL